MTDIQRLIKRSREIKGIDTHNLSLPAHAAIIRYCGTRQEKDNPCDGCSIERICDMDIGIIPLDVPATFSQQNINEGQP